MFTCILWAQKCEATPLFLFAINLIGFFHVDCPTLIKINRAVFCQWSLLKLYLRQGCLAFFARRTHPHAHIGARRTRNLVCEKYHQSIYLIFNRVCSSSGSAFSLLIISYRCRFFFFPFPPTSSSSSSSDAKFDLHPSFMRAPHTQAN
jgi:hypothetical protein